jgi:anaerobic selenocysteine-containing dehydrogenase
MSLTRREFVKATAAVGFLGLGGLLFAKAAQRFETPLQHPASAPGVLKALPDPEEWDSVKVAEPWYWHARDPARRVYREYILVPTTCNNCEANCGILAWIDKENLQIRKVTGNPLHPGSLGTLCAKGVAEVEQAYSVDRIYFPLKRKKGTRRGEMQWERITWEQALKEIGERLRYVYQRYQETKDERWLKTIIVQVGRPNEDGVIFRIGRMGRMDGACNHTNQCSSSGRYAALITWNLDRPNSAFHKTRLIIMLSAHLDGGHYFQQHAKRIIEGMQNGAKLVVLDPRLSNTAAKADLWIPVWPGTDAAVFLAVVHELLKRDAVNWDFVKNWANWQQFLEDFELLSELREKGFIETPPPPPDQLRQISEEERFELFKQVFRELYGVWRSDPDHHYSVEWAAREALGPRELLGVDEAAYNTWLEDMKQRILKFVDLVIWAGDRIASWTWRSVGAGNLGGVMGQRALYLLHLVTGSMGVEGSVMPAAWHTEATHDVSFNLASKGGNPPAPIVWNEYTYPPEYPLARNELNMAMWPLLLDEEWSHFWNERGFKIPDHLEVYWLIRIHNGVRTLPSGFFMAKAFLEGERFNEATGDYEYSLVRTVVVSDPHWSETAQFADYILPVGTLFERTDTVSMQTFEGRWTAFRTPVIRTALELMGKLQEYLKDWKEPTEEDFKKGTAVPSSVVIHRKVGLGEIADWDEAWVYLMWYVDPDGSLGIKQYWESKRRPGRPVAVPDEIFEAHYDILKSKYPTGVDALKKYAAKIGLNPENEDDLRKAMAHYLKRYGVMFWDGEPQPLKMGGVYQTVTHPVFGRSSFIRPFGDPRPNTASKFAARAVGTTPAKIDPYYRVAYDDKGNRIGIVIGGVNTGDTVVGGRIVAGYPTLSGKIETMYTLYWREFAPKPEGWRVNPYAVVIYPRNDEEARSMTHLVSQVHWRRIPKEPGWLAAVNIMRNPLHIHARNPFSKYLFELAHKHPLWMNPVDAARIGVKTGDLVRVHVVDPFTRLEAGWVVYSVFVTDMIRPGTVHTNHHTGRFRLVDYVDVDGRRMYVMPYASNRVDAKLLLEGLRSPDVLKDGKTGVAFKNVDGPIAIKPEQMPEDRRRLATDVPTGEFAQFLWWTTAGATLNWIIPVMPDPLSGQQVWNTVVRIEKAQPGDREGDAFVNMANLMTIFRWWRDNLTWKREYPARRYPGLDFTPGPTKGKPVRMPRLQPRINAPVPEAYLWPSA